MNADENFFSLKEQYDIVQEKKKGKKEKKNNKKLYTQNKDKGTYPVGITILTSPSDYKIQQQQHELKQQ